MGLALLPPEGIVTGFQWLSDMASSTEACQLLAYYKNTWLKMWQPEDFSVYRQRIRTNNDLEGVYLGLNINML